MAALRRTLTRRNIYKSLPRLMNPHRNATETELMEREASRAICTMLSLRWVYSILLRLDGVSGALKSNVL